MPLAAVPTKPKETEETLDSAAELLEPAAAGTVVSAQHPRAARMSGTDVMLAALELVMDAPDQRPAGLRCGSVVGAEPVTPFLRAGHNRLLVQ